MPFGIISCFIAQAIYDVWIGLKGNNFTTIADSLAQPFRIVAPVGADIEDAIYIAKIEDSFEPAFAG